MRIDFANATYASEQTKVHLIERDDDVVLMAEHHTEKERHSAACRFLWEVRLESHTIARAPY